MASCAPGTRPKKAAKSPQTKLISGSGDFNETGFLDFLKSVKLHNGVSYSVVAIMGPQSSGKSTLMNNLFSTNFREMNALNGRSQTTKGIWIAKAPDMEQLTMVLDMEGTDGLERGENDTFEKQSALFALAVSDIVIINMWCHDIGREHAGNRPLLKTIFEVMILLFRPEKTTLLFVLRDKTKTPLDILKDTLRTDVKKIWESVRKPQGLKKTPLSEIFNVEVTALSSYEFARDIFENEVAQLRSRFFDSMSPRLVDEKSELHFHSAKMFWDVIKTYKDLDLPPQKVMVATVRCQEIAREKLKLFKSNKDWLALQEKVKRRIVPGFGGHINSILHKHLSEYDLESQNFEKDTRNERRQYLKTEALELVRPAYMSMLGHLRSMASRRFETLLKELLSERGGFAASVRTCLRYCVLQFDQQCSDHATVEQANWDASAVREELVRDIENHAMLVRTEKLQKIVDQQRDQLCTELTRKWKNLVTEPSDKDVWSSIRRLLRSESCEAASALSSAVVMFELDKPTVEKIIHDLKQYARKLVVTKFKEDTKDVMELMKQRFLIAFVKMDTVVTEEEAYNECLKLLSVAAVIRLDARYDNVESVLLSSLTGANSGVEISADTWENVPPNMTLITPVTCRDIWSKFKREMEHNLRKAKHAQKQYAKAKKHRSFPTWVFLGLAVFGVAAFILLIRFLSIDVAIAFVGAMAASVSMIVDLKSQGLEVFWNRNRKLMKKIKRYLKELHDFMVNLLA